MSNVTLMGARGIRERVVRPFELVDWEVRRPSSRIIIFADRRAIFVFDLERHLLHLVIDGVYSSSQIVSTRRVGAWLIIRIKMNTQQQWTLGMNGQTALTPEAYARLVEVTSVHPATQQRIMGLAATPQSSELDS